MHFLADTIELIRVPAPIVERHRFPAAREGAFTPDASLSPGDAQTM
jgi:hypothetical protein